jgi:hypothetical protein
MILCFQKKMQKNPIADLLLWAWLTCARKKHVLICYWQSEAMPHFDIRHAFFSILRFYTLESGFNRHPRSDRRWLGASACTATRTALADPTRITICLARVRAVYNKFLCSMM